MKQWIIIVVALGLIIGFNYLQATFLENTCKEVLASIEKIEIAGRNNDIKAMTHAVDRLNKNWSKINIGWDIFAEHDSVESVEESITKIKGCLELDEINIMLIENDILREKVKRIVDMEKFKFVNVF